MERLLYRIRLRTEKEIFEEECSSNLQNPLEYEKTEQLNSQILENIRPVRNPYPVWRKAVT